MLTASLILPQYTEKNSQKQREMDACETTEYRFFLFRQQSRWCRGACQVACVSIHVRDSCRRRPLSAFAACVVPVTATALSEIAGSALNARAELGADQIGASRAGKQVNSPGRLFGLIFVFCCSWLHESW